MLVGKLRKEKSMKVNIRDYPNWWGPYQIAELTKYLGINEQNRYKIGNILSNNKRFNDACNWLHERTKQYIEVKLDKHDTWSLDFTLSHIIHPALVQLKAQKQGAPIVDDEDVSEELRSTSAPPKENEWDTDDNHFKRWDYVLDEMIFAHYSVCHPEWEEQFYSGECDIVFEKSDHGTSRLEWGPNHTFKADQNAIDAYNARIDNGLRLFGKYYRALWS